MENKTVVLITGGFDPVHRGHIEFMNHAKDFGDYLIVGINSDQWLTRKKGRPFMTFEDRKAVIENIKSVDQVIDFDDSDDSAVNAIVKVRDQFPNTKIVFANGGDRNISNIPEMKHQDQNLEFVFGVGGVDKKNSSSWLLEDWKAPKINRPWGHYRVLQDFTSVKLKELTVNPQSSLSLQKHCHRNEFWFVSQGRCLVISNNSNEFKELKEFDSISIPVNSWHQLTNPYNSPCKIIEIQYGDHCIEEDIIRTDIIPWYPYSDSN
jgi:cytidyltransferase-like protein